MADKPIKHFTAGAFVFSPGPPRRALLVHHRNLGVWLPPGGHLESWENPVEATIREVAEETGLDISDQFVRVKSDDRAVELPLPKYFLEETIPPSKKSPQHYHLDMWYVVQVSLQSVRHSTRESEGIGWFTWDELQALPMFDNTRTILKQEMS